MTRKIGIRRESTLHAALKKWYLQPGDLLEEAVDGYVVDILRGEKLVEIQTGNFKTGSKGFYANTKVEIDGKRYQVQIQLVEIGSKTRSEE